MKQKTIIGTAMGLAAIAVLIDHTRHTLPQTQPAVGDDQEEVIILCGLEGSPCGLELNPCGLGPDMGGDSNPCGL
jgi:hypothetical protein